MGVLIKVVNPSSIKTARSSLDAMHFISFLKQQLSQIATVLAADTSNKSFLHQSKTTSNSLQPKGET